MEEVWKDIKGYEGMYQVSNLGRVRSLNRIITNKNKKYEIKGKIISNSTSKLGYKKVTLQSNGERKTFQVHRLVAQTFINNPNDKPQVNHIDGDKANNQVHNLEWVTSSENITHAFAIGLKQITEEIKEKMSESTKGANHPMYGKCHTEEAKRKMSEGHKGKNMGSKHPKSKKIICINTGEIFNCAREANEKYNINIECISACCRGEHKSAGKHPITKEKLVWKYIE